MGNSESKDVPKSPSTPSAPSGSRNRDVSSYQRRDREGVPSVRKAPSSHVTTSAPGNRTQTPPTANLVAQSSASISTSNATAQATVSASPASTSSQHSRARSITHTGSKKLRPEELGGGASSHKSDTSAMGNAESRHRPPSRSSTLPPPSAGKFEQPSPSTQPVDVPAHPTHDGLNETQDQDITPPSASPYGLPASQLSRPPRLPLPIERDPEPSSPIITPQDVVPPPLGNETLEADEEGQDSYLPRRASLLSSTTLDDEDAADIEQFAVESNPLAQKVPTTLTWRGAAHSVYFTGTFCNWEKKFRMHRERDGETYTVTMPLAVGTHHITFLVDGEPKVSLHLPTTVDFANALVNYIEVAAPQSPTEEKAQPIPAGPVPIPGKEQQLQEEGVDAVEWVDEDIEPSQRDKGEALQPPGAGDEIDQALRDSIGSNDAQGSAPSSQRPTQPNKDSQQQQQQEKQRKQQGKPAVKPRAPRPKYTTEIPQILLDLDLYTPTTPPNPATQANDPYYERFRRAQRAIQALPQPPSLPMFMSKSILNTATPHKDDASVLAMPNHTVLNHLATSSIRNGVLATSGTTRYKRKFLTTIMYKPTSEDG